MVSSSFVMVTGWGRGVVLVFGQYYSKYQDSLVREGDLTPL